jgi:hypothetical protein
MKGINASLIMFKFRGLAGMRVFELSTCEIRKNRGQLMYAKLLNI